MNRTVKHIPYILIAALLMLSIAGCDIESPKVSDTPDIRFSLNVTDGLGTRALLESDDLYTNGTQVLVYGFAGEDLAGHTEGGAAGTTKLNDGQTIRYGTDGWSFTSGELYQWKYNQTHKFFCWLTNDAKSGINASTFFSPGLSFNSSSKVLSIPAKTLGIATTNFDFAYSDIVNRPATDADYSTVELTLNHLFSSFSLSATNYSARPVTIKGIEMHGIQDGKSATINYSGSSVAVTYAGGNVTNPTLLSGNVSLTAAGTAGDAKANVVGAASTTPAYFLVWPQTDMDYDGTVDGDGRPAPATGDANEPYLKITYTQDGEDFTFCSAIPHDEDGWVAGVRYELELVFQDREINLGFKAAPWDKLEPVIDYNGAVSVSQKLRLAPDFVNNCTLSPNFATDQTAYFKSGTPIILEFAISTPANATWLVGKKLDWDVFDVYNYPDGARTSPDEIITAEGVVDGNLVRIAIDPPTKDLQKSEFSLELSFTVRLNNGDMITINDDDIYSEGCPRKFVYIKL